MSRLRYCKGYKYQLRAIFTLLVNSHNYPRLTAACEKRISIKPFLHLSHSAHSLNPEKPNYLILQFGYGYAWDGASGPMPDFPYTMRASMVHDALYQLMRKGRIPRTCRKEADLILYRIARHDGMPRFLAWLMYAGVRLFAGYATSDRAGYKPIDFPE